MSVSFNCPTFWLLESRLLPLSPPAVQHSSRMHALLGIQTRGLFSLHACPLGYPSPANKRAPESLDGDRAPAPAWTSRVRRSILRFRVSSRRRLGTPGPSLAYRRNASETRHSTSPIRRWRTPAPARRFGSLHGHTGPVPLGDPGRSPLFRGLCLEGSV